MTDPPVAMATATRYDNRTQNGDAPRERTRHTMTIDYEAIRETLWAQKKITAKKYAEYRENEEAPFP
jgi:hypothetical protein